ncbi:MAG: hypothetical protein Q9197_004004 [Variospora fuerteventurae]
MFVNALMLNTWHPMKYLPNDNKIYISRDGATERLGPGWKDSRPFLITLLDPFDIAGVFMKRDKEKFWDHEDEHPIVGQDTIVTDKAGEAKSAVLPVCDQSIPCLPQGGVEHHHPRRRLDPDRFPIGDSDGG